MKDKIFVKSIQCDCSMLCLIIMSSYDKTIENSIEKERVSRLLWCFGLEWY